MDRAATIAAIGGMLGTFAENVPDETWDVVLARSVVPDTAGRWPGSAGYVDSYDPEWAAAELVSIRIDQTMTSETVTEWSSEGSRFRSTPADLVSLEQRLRSRSVIARCQPDDVLGRITVPGSRINYGTRSGGWPDTERRHVITNRD